MNLATTALPIGGNSLIYGSSDGGATVHKDDPRLNQLMKKAAKELHIKGHKVGFSGQLKKLYAPTDIEGHKGRDSRFYVLDTARISPPEPPMRGFIAVEVPTDERRKDIFEELPPIHDLQLHRNTFQDEVDKILEDRTRKLGWNCGDEFQVSEFEILDGSMFFVLPKQNADRDPKWINSRASMIVQKVIYGDAIIVLKGRKGGHLYRLFRYLYHLFFLIYRF